MAIISCPACSKKISDKAKECSHCHYDFISKTTAQGESEEQLASKKKLSYVKKRYSLQMQAMAGIILFLAGAMLWYFGGRGFSSASDFIKLGMLALGAIWYLATRVRLILFKKGR